jgi:Fe-S cluster assembly iron-binding protein IscA
MLTVTESAATMLHDTLDKHATNDSDVLRVAMNDGGVGIELGEERAGDETFSHGGKIILAIEHDLSSALDGARIDTVETPEGRQLVFESPELENDGYAGDGVV